MLKSSVLLSAARDWRYKPATVGGVPVTVAVRVVVLVAVGGVPVTVGVLVMVAVRVTVGVRVGVRVAGVAVGGHWPSPTSETCVRL